MRSADEREGLARLLCYVPRSVADAVKRCDASLLAGLTEIRLRLGKPVVLCFGSKLCFLSFRGITENRENVLIVSTEDMDEAWRAVTASSVYALEEELRRGFITLNGGHRVGVAGTAVLREGNVRTQKEIGSLNYRFAREKKGIGIPLLPFLQKEGDLENTLLFSPPCGGKTTLLRDLLRLFSDGWGQIPPHNTVLVDERHEVAAVWEGRAFYDVGLFTDVLSGFPKAEGMELALRSLAPMILAADEIGTEADRRAVENAIRAGVSLLLTAHGGSLDELRERPFLASLLREGVFRNIVELSPRPCPGTISRLYRRERKNGGFCYVEDPAFLSCGFRDGMYRRDPSA